MTTEDFKTQLANKTREDLQKVLKLDLPSLKPQEHGEGFEISLEDLFQLQSVLSRQATVNLVIDQDLEGIQKRLQRLREQVKDRF
jgi:hypothetical protein